MVLKRELTANFYENIKTNIRLKQAKPSFELPSYIKLTDHPLSQKGWILWPQTLNGHFIYVNWHILSRRIKQIGWLLFWWEAVIILSLTLLFYRLLWLNLKQRETNKELLETILLSLSHNLGNFLATQRLNLEILKSQTASQALSRLEKSHLHLERELKNLSYLIENLKDPLKEKEHCNLKEIIENTLSLFQPELSKRRLKIKLSPLIIKSRKAELNAIIYIILENAVKYGGHILEIRLDKTQKRLIIKNDLSECFSKGAGKGLKLAQKLAEINDIKLEYGYKEGQFSVCLAWQ